MNEDQMSALQTTNKEEIAEYLFERTAIDLALAGREILNKIITKQYAQADLTTLVTIANGLQDYMLVADGVTDPHLPLFIKDAFVKFTEKFSKKPTEPMMQGTP